MYDFNKLLALSSVHVSYYSQSLMDKGRKIRVHGQWLQDESTWSSVVR